MVRTNVITQPTKPPKKLVMDDESLWKAIDNMTIKLTYMGKKYEN